MTGTLQWVGVAASTAVLGTLGLLWLLGRRAVARLHREREKGGRRGLAAAPGPPTPSPRPPKS
jgi:hypothetical protein